MEKEPIDLKIWRLLCLNTSGLLVKTLIKKGSRCVLGEKWQAEAKTILR